MNNNQISNPETKVPTGIEPNDKDCITSMLTCVKEMEKNYCIAMTEASNENLYNKYHNMFNEIATLGRDIYELMFRKGWYKLEKAETTKITSKYQTLNQELQDLQTNN